jgi:uncharacterized protein HemX
MRAALALVPVLGLALVVSACDKHSTVQTTVQSDARDAQHQVDHAVSGVTHSSEMRQVQADLRSAGRDAGHDLHKAANEARDAFHHLANDAHHSVHQAAGHDSSDHNANSNS